ncbi:MAG TPA: CBS domain-containing protein [Conexivisphaerales archaeon]|nr:CBS domain-containing protein [Conexivisphaerales archaeon]
MKVGDLVRLPPVTIEPEATLVDAARLMSTNRIGLVLVVDPMDRARMVGVISERDIVTAVAKGESIFSPIENIMTKQVITIPKDARLDEAAMTMSKFSVRHLVVVDGAKPFGVISIRDIISEEKILKALSTSVF